VRIPKLAAHDRIVVRAALTAITTLRKAIDRIRNVMPTTNSRNRGMRSKMRAEMSSKAAVAPPT